MSLQLLAAYASMWWLSVFRPQYDYWVHDADCGMRYCIILDYLLCKYSSPGLTDTVLIGSLSITFLAHLALPNAIWIC